MCHFGRVVVMVAAYAHAHAPLQPTLAQAYTHSDILLRQFMRQPRLARTAAGTPRSSAHRSTHALACALMQARQRQQACDRLQTAADRKALARSPPDAQASTSSVHTRARCMRPRGNLGLLRVVDPHGCDKQPVIRGKSQVRAAQKPEFHMDGPAFDREAHRLALTTPTVGKSGMGFAEC